MHSLTSHELTIFLTAVGIMLILARVLSKIGTRFNIPTVVAELMAGIILGPTILGTFIPQLHEIFFPDSGRLQDAYDTLFNLSVVMLLFLAGLHLDFTSLAKQKKAIFITCFFALMIPFAIGVWTGWHFFDFFYGVEFSAAPFTFPLIFGTIISISSLSLIARILIENNIMNTPIGITIMGTSLITDVLGWFAFSSILIYADHEVGNLHILYTAIYIILFFVVTYFISNNKKLMDKLFTHKHDGESSYDIAMLFGICLLAGAFTNAIDIHPSLGAFIAGIMCKRIIGENSMLLKQLELFIMNFFVPIMFISIGLHLDFTQDFYLLMVIVVMIIAFVAKLIGAVIGARLGGFSAKPAWIVAFGLNARGSMAIIMSALALKTGLIGPQLFVSFVIMAVGTSFLTESAMLRLLKKM